MSEKPTRPPRRPQPTPPPQVVYVTAPKPAWRYWANLLIVAGALFGCMICVLYIAAGG